MSDIQNFGSFLNESESSDNPFKTRYLSVNLTQAVIASDV